MFIKQTSLLIHLIFQLLLKDLNLATVNKLIIKKLA